MIADVLNAHVYVHCRTGSLEILVSLTVAPLSVHCRTGSLENSITRDAWDILVHCRTGSLESKGISHGVD